MKNKLLLLAVTFCFCMAAQAQAKYNSRDFKKKLVWIQMMNHTSSNAQTTYTTPVVKKSAVVQPKKFEAVREKEGKEEGEHEDMAYEMKHKNSAWFKAMSKPHANYFAVKKQFDKYFAKHKWEGSQSREFGAGWIKTKIFYLDKKGFVQDAPAFDPSTAPLSVPPTPGVTTRDVGGWHMIGPVNSLNIGPSIPGNKGGFVYMNRIDPTNPQKMFVSFQTGGLWTTSDGGTSWTLTDVNLPDVNYIDLDVCISNPSVVYAVSSQGGIVIKSIDGGLSWNATALTSASIYAGNPAKGADIAVSPTNPNVVVARWGSNIYRTADGGATWSLIVSGLNEYEIWTDCSNLSEMVDWSTTDNNVVYFLNYALGNQVQVYRSADAGVTFSIMTTITLDPAANGQVVGWAKLFLPSNNATAIYVAIGTGDAPTGHHAVQLYKLNNTTGAEILKRVNMRDGLTDEGGVHHGDMTMDRTDETKLVYGTYFRQFDYYSTDNGVSFTPSATNFHNDHRSLDMINGRVLTGTDGEAELSTDGGINYTNLTNSISNHELWGFGAAFKSDMCATGNDHGPNVIKEAGTGTEWFTWSGGDASNVDVNPLDDRYIFANNGGGESNLLMFRNGNQTISQHPTVIGSGGGDYLNNLEFHPNLYYSLICHSNGGNDLIRTDDNGVSSTIVHTFAGTVARNKIYMKDPKIIYVLVGRSDGRLWKTTDGGATWADVTPSSAATSGETNISDIALSDTDPNQVWVSYSSVQTVCKVLKSTNGGTSWANLTTPTLTANPVTRMVYQRGSNGGVYVGTHAGVFYRNNTMPDWVLIGNLPALEVPFMFINYNLGKIRIGTSRGAWEHDLYETSPPQAQISASTNKWTCIGGPIQFRDYSTVRNASATWAWSFPGATPSTSNLENPVVSYFGQPNGFHNVSLTVTDAYGTSSQTLTNFIQVTAAPSASSLPYSQTFEGTVFPPTGLTLSSTGKNFEQSTSVGGFGTSSKSASFINWENANLGTTASMITNPISISSPGLTAASLSFDVAYSRYAFDDDTLTVSVSTNCGPYIELYRKNGTQLSTNGGGPNGGASFVPTASEWRTDSIDISAYIGQAVSFKISDVVMNGNNLYIDNLNINTTTNPSYTITASAGANGSISPSGAVSVVSGANQTFTITPAGGYYVQDVLVDGTSQGALTIYTF